MKFIVTRTSHCCNYETKPCDEAKEIEIPRYDIRRMTEEEYNRKFGKEYGLWRSEGTNHTTINRGKWIKRQLGIEKVWYIEIKSLEELMSFQDKYGDLVLTRVCFNDEYKEIEIYDSYRE